MNEKQNEVKSDVISGRNPVSEAIRGNRPIDKILVAKGEKNGAIVAILAKAKAKQIPVKEVDRVKLDFLSGSSAHQGIIAFAAVRRAKSKCFKLFVLLLHSGRFQVPRLRGEPCRKMFRQFLFC